MLGRFLEALRSVDVSWVTDETLERLPEAEQTTTASGRPVRVAGVNLNRRRTRAVLEAVVALATQPGGFQAGELADRVRQMTGQTYEPRHMAYDVRKLRAKGLVERQGRRYTVPSDGLRTMAALVVLREKVLRPLLACAGKLRTGRKPRHRHILDDHYESIQREFQQLFQRLQLAA
jgi:hypothetical protein